MKRKEGLTLVELIVAIGVFAIIMLALSGTIVNGLQVRRKNNAQAHAVAHANAIIEAYKNDWSVSSRYMAFDPDQPSTFPPSPATANLPFPGSGIQINAELCASYNKLTETFDPHTREECKPPPGTGRVSGGDVRFLTVTIKDAQGKELVKLTAEVGKPVL